MVPGNLDYKTCIKHAEFSGCYCNRTSGCSGTNLCTGYYDRQTWCRKHTSTIAMSTKKTIKVDQEGLSLSMFHLKKSGYIGQDSMYGNASDDLGTTTLYNFMAYPRNQVTSELGQTSFDFDVKVSLLGYSSVEGVDKNLSNKYYAKLVAGHNMISFFARKVTATVYNKGKANEYTQYWNAQTDFAGFSSKVAAQLDAKIDDGRPGTGRLFGLKSEAATRTGATRQTILNSCYDGDFTDDSIKKSIYHSDTNTKYGCNLLYVMEDVK